VNRKGLVVFGGLLAVAHGLSGVTAIGAVRRRWFPALAGVGAADHVALTFDDGPDPASTPRFVEALAEHGVSATFFLLGRMAARAPGLAADLVAAGHEVGVHGWAHRNALLLTPRAVYDDLARAQEVIARSTGVVPAFYRPPYGVLSSGALVAARRLGLTPVLWTVDGHDWTARSTPESVLAAVRPRLRGGGTVLLHDCDCTSAPDAWRSALGALPGLFAECADRGLRIGPLREHHDQFSRIARSDSRSEPMVANTAVGS
jgi:peptidoglycan-N-acetylglucosamine deacetylase